MLHAVPIAVVSVLALAAAHIAPAHASSVRKPPKRLRAELAGGDVLLRWKPQARAHRYRIHARTVGVRSPRWKRRPLATTKRSRFRHKGLAPGSVHVYQVVARLRGGRLTRASRKVRITIPAAGPPAAPQPAPSAPPAEPALPPATRFVSTSGSEAGACTSAAPCASLDRAYDQAAPGEVVEIAAGTYGRQEIDGSKPAGAPVYFRPAVGAAVRTGDVEITANGVELRRIITSGWYVRPGSDRITFRSVIAEGTIFITSASNVSVIGGSVGPGDSQDSQIKAADTNGAPPPRNILIDGVDFHDWTRVQDPDAHVECLQFGAGVDVTIRNSKFRNCETQGLFFRSWGGTAEIGNLLIENNWFDRTTAGYYPLKISQMDGQVYQNVTIRYNSGLQPFIVDPGSSQNVTWIGNVAPRTAAACVRDHVFRFNVWDGVRCGSTDKDAPLAFVNAAAMDLHLAAGSPAIGAGDPANHPARDIDGQARPRSGAPDAGADEH